MKCRNKTLHTKAHKDYIIKPRIANAVTFITHFQKN